MSSADPAHGDGVTPGANPALADVAVATVRGSEDARRLLLALRDGCAPADALLEALQAVLSLDDAERLRGFARQLQKTLERRT